MVCLLIVGPQPSAESSVVKVTNTPCGVQPGAMWLRIGPSQFVVLVSSYCSSLTLFVTFIIEHPRSQVNQEIVVVGQNLLHPVAQGIIAVNEIRRMGQSIQVRFELVHGGDSNLSLRFWDERMVAKPPT
jgi:hypothetical protein